MEHFSVVQSIIRAGLAGDQAALDKQVTRLRSRLEKSGMEKEAETLIRLLQSATETKEIAPSRVETSRAQIRGEVLTRETHPPIDRETGAQLCSVDFRDTVRDRPIYGQIVEDTINSLLEEWSNVDALRLVGVEPTRSLLIYGPPGSGKTLTARFIAEKLGLPLVTARIDGLISSFLGTTARNIASLFDFANRYACVLLLDEFDALAKLRDDPQEIGEIKRVVNTLLQNLDRRGGYGVTIAITNHDRLLDPAVWRRFQTQIHIGEPDGVAREQLVERFLRPLTPDPGIYRIIAYCLEGRSGADIERVCDAVKRTMVLSGASSSAPALFAALNKVLSRSPNHNCVAARILARDVEAFISLIANDADFKMKQSDIGEATGYSQSRISDLKKDKRHLTLLEHTHAQ